MAYNSSMNKYHAHIYFKLEEKAKAEVFFDRAQHCQEKIFSVWKLYPQKVGPHALPMVEMHFNQDTRASVIKWLEDNREGFSVLIHQDTGDDVRDHLSGIQWLGEVLPIDFDFFELVKKDKSLLVHPEE